MHQKNTDQNAVACKAIAGDGDIFCVSRMDQFFPNSWVS